MDDAQLAQVLTELVDRLDVLEHDRNELARQAGEQQRAMGGLLEGVEVLSARLAEAEKRAREKKTDWGKVTSWAGQATAEQWTGLVAWVDWMVSTYRYSQPAPLPSCWPRHAGAVEELAALWEAWLVARATMKSDPTDQMAYWHDRYLLPTLTRLTGTDLLRCKDGHQEPVVAPRLTDRSTLPQPVEAPKPEDVPPPDDRDAPPPDEGDAPPPDEF